MNAQKNLLAAYQSWEELSQVEGTAIRKCDWLHVEKCQHTKRGLQKEIIHWTEAAKAEWRAAGLNAELFEQDTRRIINNLIALESRNSEWLAQSRAAADAARAELDQTAHNLRRVQKSYASRAEAVWNSYS